ncbi:MAG: hypothetical protein Q9M40_10380 [Sulfurimonas sp.]|nr:hypothetical protein [Sulfurimonas sp.]
MSEQQDEMKALILREIQKYKEESSSMKPLSQSMKEFSSWLSQKEKS